MGLCTHLKGGVASDRYIWRNYTNVKVYATSRRDGKTAAIPLERFSGKRSRGATTLTRFEPIHSRPVTHQGPGLV
jgi:hypothetical protein